MRTLPRSGRECSPPESYPSAKDIGSDCISLGAKHAGENLSDVLKQRAAGLAAPIQMCDALSRNLPKLPRELEIIIAHCLAHYLDFGIIQSECVGGAQNGANRSWAS
jgi:hypothetical protein